MKAIIFSVLAVTSVGFVAQAQYTPGAGGTYAPSTPVVPAPARPQTATPPNYSWEVPMTPAAPAQPAQATGLQPVQPDVVRIVAPEYVPQYTDQQLADFTAAIALYPDPLLSEMLPATTFVQQITYADKWLAQHPGADEGTIASLPVDDSVKCMMHYPSVLTMMADHLDWTQSLGAAFVYQRTDLMESVQRWRSTAVAYGTLASSPQQDVLRQGNVIMIVPPARQTVVYVPVYDPAVVYVRPVRPVGNYITFAAGGFSLTFVQNDLDWHDHQVRVPVHHDDHDVVVRGGPPPKAIFTHDDFKPVIPTKVMVPQPDHKVVVISPTQPHGRGPGGGPGGGADHNPATPW